MMQLTPGRELGGRFVLLRRIAEGSGSQLWLAEDRQASRRVALKLLDPARLATPEARARLQAELDIAARLDPGQAVQAYGLHELDGLLLIAMEYLPGGDLGQFRGRAFTTFIRPLQDVASALATAHARGLVHRDLKCANVLLDDRGRARLADFGLATLAGRDRPGGSPYNMSPQQLRGEPASPADDLYAFGAMLFELLTGHPPYYPDITTERVLHEPVPPLVPRAPAPERLRELARRLLAKSPAARPADMDAVGSELAAALAEPEDSATAVPAAAPAVTPRPPQSRKRPVAQSTRRGAILALALVVAAGLVFVFVLLPERVAERVASRQQEVTAEALAEAERARQAGQEAEAREQARGAAEKAREAFATRLARLESQAAGGWAAETLATARAGAAAAARELDRGAAEAAKQAWDAASALLDTIEAGRPAALAAALADGDAATSRGDAEAAARAYRLALAIEPGNAAAQRGLERAGKLDEVFALLDTAARDEQAGRIDSAQAGYRRALALDAAAPGARDALARIAARQARDTFAASMSRGMAALAAGRFDEAAAAFDKARSLQPGAAEVDDALAELARSRKESRLQALTDKALAAERGEDWKLARETWSAALALEATLVPAREGLERSTPRMQLDARIDALIEQPDKLWGQAGKREAEQLLAAAADAAAPRQALTAKAARLGVLLEEARTPVRLALQSDGVTDVVIYRVGRIGAFERREVEVMPGRYAIVGTRRGYRDVRKEVEVPPGSVPQPVVVRCEEPI